MCDGCGKRVTSLLITKIGRRCFECVVKNNLLFILNEYSGNRYEWVYGSGWVVDSKNNLK